MMGYIDQDILTVGESKRYWGNFGKYSGPNSVKVAMGEAIKWISLGDDDVSGTNQDSGFEICAELSVFVDNLTTRRVGFILLPIYLLGPIVYLWVIGKRVKDNLGVEGDLDYKDSLNEVQRKAEKDIVSDVKTGEERMKQELNTPTDGYKAAVISGLIGSFEEDY